MFNNIYFVFLSLLLFIYIVNVVRNKKISIKESFWWVLLSIIMIILSIFPTYIDSPAKSIGIDYPPSLLFIICIVFLLLINFRNSKNVSELQMKVAELAQELAIVKEKIKK